MPFLPMGSDNQPNLKDTKAKLDYLKELLTDRNILANDPRTYLHVGKILEKEILRIRSALFATYGINPISESELPDPEGPKVNLQTKVYMPTDSVSSFNFVGRILGPDGSTAKCLQQCLGVKIMVRGRGSMRDRKKEEANIGKPNWEHLSDRLHVVLTVEDYENRAKARLAKASEYITVFLKESMKGSDKDDKVKQMQLMELSFRREPCPSWRFNCNNLLDISFPQKSGAFFSNTAANFFNFGYAYPPSAPLFSTLQPSAVPSTAHLGPYAQPSQPPNAVPQTPGQTAAAQAASNPIAAGYSHAYAGNVNAATLLLGHTPNNAAAAAAAAVAAAGYPSPYSPNSHTQATGPGLTVAPMSYWASQGMSQIPGDYAFAQLNGGQPNEVASSTSLLDSTGAASSSSCQTGCGLYPNARVPTDELMQHYVLTELGGCHLDEFRDLSIQGSHAVEVYTDNTKLHSMNSVNGSRQSAHGAEFGSDKNNNTVNSGQNGSLSKTSTGHKRYSHKHPCQLPNRSNQPGPGPVRSAGRSGVVTVRIGSSSHENSKGLRTSNSSLLFMPSSRIANATSNGRISHTSSDTDEDWPRLGSGAEREKVLSARLTVPSEADDNVSRDKLPLEEERKET